MRVWVCVCARVTHPTAMYICGHEGETATKVEARRRLHKQSSTHVIAVHPANMQESYSIAREYGIH